MSCTAIAVALLLQQQSADGESAAKPDVEKAKGSWHRHLMGRIKDMKSQDMVDGGKDGRGNAGKDKKSKGMKMGMKMGMGMKKGKKGGTFSPMPSPATPSTNFPNAPSSPTGSMPVTDAPVVSIPVPVPAPVSGPVSGPVPAPVQAPVPMGGIPCIPTAGQCLTTNDEILNAISAATLNEVITICEGTAPIVISSALIIEQAGVTLCSENSDPALTILQGDGSDNILNVFGNSVTLQGITFENGVSDVFFGGNVAIDADGEIVIRNSVLRNGVAPQIGGNAFVQTRGNLLIENSVFANGRAGDAGGALYVLNARSVTVRNSFFTSNSAAGGTGGAFFSVMENATDVGQDIVFENVEFNNNEASIGGAFFVTQLGSLPSLAILNTVFTDNTGTDAAGAGAIADSLDNLSLTVTASTGTRNIAPVCNDLLGFFDASVQPFCIDANLPYP